MRQHALHADRVRFVAGVAEAIPLRTAAVDVAWLSVVVHHFNDLSQAAREVRRVVRTGGTVLLRTAIPDLVPRSAELVEQCVRAAGMDGTVMYSGLLFPSSLDVIDSFPSLDDLDIAFGDAGFERIWRGPGGSGQAESMRKFRDRVAVRADSTLVPLSDDEWERGMARLDAMVDAELEPTPSRGRAAVRGLRVSRPASIGVEDHVVRGRGLRRARMGG